MNKITKRMEPQVVEARGRLIEIVMAIWDSHDRTMGLHEWRINYPQFADWNLKKLKEALLLRQAEFLVVVSEEEEEKC